MAQAKTAAQERNREIVRFAAQLMKNGIADSVIQTKIVEMGMTNEQASAVVSSLRQVRKRVRRRTGIRNMVMGGLFCIGGIVITVVSISASKSGGFYIVTWGAILFGALQFFGGLFQYLGK